MSRNTHSDTCESNRMRPCTCDYDPYYKDDKLTIKPKMPSFRRGISANIKQAEETIKQTDPTTVPNRLGMIFDDSGSMGTGTDSRLEHAKTAVKNFTASCNFTDTSITIYPLNLPGKPLTIDYDILNMFVLGIESTGGTPLYTKLLEILEKESITRAIVFSDGGPTDSKLIGTSEYYDSKPIEFAINTVKQFIEKKIPVDTIYIGEEYNYGNEKYSAGYEEMLELAKQTGGIFIHFKDASSLSKNLKYLAPRYRALLANAEIKKQIEEGKTI